MAKLIWDTDGERRYENGVDHGVLYPRSNTGDYPLGVAWNGLTAVTESPEGAESTVHYADNIPCVSMQSAEIWKGTIEAFTFPDEFIPCDGAAVVVDGLVLGQQKRQSFGFSWRTRIGNDVTANAGYKIHIVYGALAAPSEKANSTINESPEPMTFSWEVSTTPTPVTGHEALSTLTLISTDLDPVKLTELENILYGTTGTPGTVARLPKPDEIIALLEP